MGLSRRHSPRFFWRPCSLTHSKKSLLLPPLLGPPIRFTDVTKKSGITFTYDTDLRQGRNLATMGAGVAMGDFDGDSFPDLFFVGLGRERQEARRGPVRRALPQPRRRHVRGRDGAFGNPVLRLEDGRVLGGPRRRGTPRPRRDGSREGRSSGRTSGTARSATWPPSGASSRPAIRSVSRPAT